MFIHLKIKVRTRRTFDYCSEHAEAATEIFPLNWKVKCDGFPSHTTPCYKLNKNENHLSKLDVQP